MNEIRKTNRNFRIRMVVLITFLFIGSFQVFAQDKIENFQINRFWGGVSEEGAKTNFGHNNLGLFADYSAYGDRLQSNETTFGGFIAITQTNWTAPDGKVIPYAVFSPTSPTYLPNGKVIKPIESYLRYKNPEYNVEQTNIGPIISNLGTVDPSKCIGTSDQTITVTNEYVNGIQIQRKIIGWSQQFNDNYVIVDMTFTNTSSKPVDGMYVSLQEGPYYMLRADGRNPGVASVDSHNGARWFHYTGAKNTDSLRVFYQYSADDQTRAGDQMGQPLTQEKGRLLQKDFTFLATLHASKQPYTPTPNYSGAIDPNDQDDMSQPSVALVANLQKAGIQNYPIDPDQKNIYDFIAGLQYASEDQTGADIRPGHFRKNLDNLGLESAGGQPGISAQCNTFESMCVSYGPYNLQPGQQIRIIKVSGIAGLSRKKALEIGEKWLNKDLPDPMPKKPKGLFPDNFVFPSGATQNDINKDKWLSTGIDSVYTTVQRAEYNLKTDYKIPVEPPPPTTFTVLGTGKGIELSWSDTQAEQMNGFIGYRIMRKVSAYDTTFYQQVATIPSTDKGASHTYTDKNILFGAQYYYYIQAGVRIGDNDQNAFPSSRGKIIWTGRIWYPQNTYSFGKRASQDDLNKIVIAPNPYNYNDPLIKDYGWTGDRGILFFNLPSTVTIKIFTENGDLVKTIYHDEPVTKTGSDYWNMTNESRQPIASGIYVVVFQKSNGELSYKKLVVAR